MPSLVATISPAISPGSLGLHAFLTSSCPPCQCGFPGDFPPPFRSKSFTPSLSAELAQMNCVGVPFLLLAHVRPERYVEGVHKINKESLTVLSAKHMLSPKQSRRGGSDE